MRKLLAAAALAVLPVFGQAQGVSLVGYGIDIAARRSGGIWKETLETKAYWAGAGRVDPFSCMASWRVGVRTKAA